MKRPTGLIVLENADANKINFASESSMFVNFLHFSITIAITITILSPDSIL
jgi:hypothetical protein